MYKGPRESYIVHIKLIHFDIRQTFTLALYLSDQKRCACCVLSLQQQSLTCGCALASQETFVAWDNSVLNKTTIQHENPQRNICPNHLKFMCCKLFSVVRSGSNMRYTLQEQWCYNQRKCIFSYSNINQQCGTFLQDCAKVSFCSNRQRLGPSHPPKWLLLSLLCRWYPTVPIISTTAQVLACVSDIFT